MTRDPNDMSPEDGQAADFDADVDPFADEHNVKRDRAARLLRVVHVLEGRGEQGARIEEIARLVSMSKRTVYRDLKALEGEMRMPVWSDGGRWGIDRKGFLPPLKLTRAEAMAVFLSARLMVRYADEYDADLAGAFQKLAGGLPPVLAEHVARTLDIMSRRPVDPEFTRRVHDLTRAWAERRVVTFVYDPSSYDPGRGPREARVHPWYVEPSVATHALYLIGFDETRKAVRTFKIERISDLVIAPETFSAPEESVEDAFVRAWDIIADQPEVEVVLRFDPAIAARVQEATWHPSQAVELEADGSLLWRARVAGTIEIRLWILSWGQQVEVLSPPTLRDDLAATYRAAAARYGESAPA